MLPTRLAAYATGVALRQDVTFLTMGKWGTSAAFVANHVPPASAPFQPLAANNPSWASFTSDAAPEGANIAMADGSVRWHGGPDLEDVGRAECHPADHHLISLPSPP